MTDSPFSSRLVRLFGSSIVDQALLSGANFLVGLILIRYASETQYGYYVLAFNGMMLATTLQGTFISTPLVIRLPGLDADARRSWIGGLWRDQRRWTAAGSAVALAAIGLAWAADALQPDALPVCIAAVALLAAATYREYFRGILLVYQRPHAVLAADTVYVAGLIAGGLLAMRQPVAATIALGGAALSALACGRLLRRALRDDMDADAPPGRMREIAHVGFWAASGGVIYWLFNQGYSFLAAATLDLAAVAALAASRLVMMPVNLVTAGVQKQLTPIASGWLHQLGPRATARRLVLFSAILGAMTLIYLGIAWLLRDWIFIDLMRKDFAQRDVLFQLWAAVFLVMSLRDPLMLLLLLRQRLRTLTAITLGSALLSLAICQAAMLRWGATGAPFGVLCGELFYIIAVLVCTRAEIRRAETAAGAQEALP